RTITVNSKYLQRFIAQGVKAEAQVAPRDISHLDSGPQVPPYRSSVVGTDFDFITESDPDTFVRLEDKGQGPAEMPDKRGRSAPPEQEAAPLPPQVVA